MATKAKNGTIVVKTEPEIHQDILRVYRNGLERRGISNPDVSKSTEFYIKAQAVAQSLAVLNASVVAGVDQALPDTATGPNLTRIAKLFKLSLRDAVGSAGFMWLTSSVSPVTVPAGSMLVDEAGLRYAVAAAGSYSDGDEIPIEAVDLGTQTNIAGFSTLTWFAPPAHVSTTALVNEDGLTDGEDQEDEEALRARVLERLQQPPAAGNWSYINSIAEESHPSVQKAFTYQAYKGPATVHVAVCRKPTLTNKGRDITQSTVDNIIEPKVRGELPTGIYVDVDTVENQETDVAFELVLPLAQTAVPAGPGGGWIDGTPFPQPASGSTYVRVSAMTSTQNFTLDNCNDPVDGVSSIAFVSRSDWKLYRATVISSSVGSGTCTVVTDKPLVGLEAGDFVFPDAENMDTYVDATLKAFSELGPGKKTDQPGVLPEAYRKPDDFVSWPSRLDGLFLRKLTDSAEEIQAAQFLYRSSQVPDVPTTIDSKAKVLTPRRLAFYKVE